MCSTRSSSFPLLSISRFSTSTSIPKGLHVFAGTLVLDAGGNFRKADASGFDGKLVVKGGKAILNRTFKPVAREVADGAEIVWIEAGTVLIFG